MKIILSIAILSASVSVFGQIQSHDFYSFRMNNMINVNPAYTNYNEGVTVYLGGLAQNKGVNFNTKNLTAGAYSRITDKQGLGVNVITDVRGAFQTTKAALSYAYTAKFNDEAKLTFGLSAGIIANNLSLNRIEGNQYLDMTDPTLDADYFNRTQFIAGAGLLFQWKKLDVSLSLPHVVTTNTSLNPYIHGQVEYTFDLGKNFKLAPSFAYQNMNVLGSIYSGYAKLKYRDMLWIKTGYQSNESFQIMAGVDVENIGLGYAFRMNNGRFSNVSTGTHEVTLNILIPKKNTKTRTQYNPTLIEIDHRLTKLLTKKITEQNKLDVIAEVKEVRRLMQSTEINNSTPEASNEAADYLNRIEIKLVELQTRINEK